MKTIASFTLCMLFLSTYSFGQSLYQVKTTVSDSVSLKNTIQNGTLTVVFNKEVSANKIATSASYYTNYFTVDYDENSGSALIKYKDNSSMSRKVTSRFLVSNNVRQVIVGNKTLSIEEFISAYL